MQFHFLQETTYVYRYLLAWEKVQLKYDRIHNKRADWSI